MAEVKWGVYGTLPLLERNPRAATRADRRVTLPGVPAIALA
jgi:hypothetical protein